VGTEVLCSFPRSRVLDGPRGQVAGEASVVSESQRKLIMLAGRS
jgi:hypothetical protein